ncbi:MAG: hypothetical protein VB133_09655 [Anaeromusa sp.]|uniref:plasmid mobilization protein n=1 Tax=Anaeromusa sp. TaxID=1872520 RepID=UPI002B20F6AE|nr:hypothetical protein [Anaeromusa sp.]MEA4835389.1 hypothetical protein [Anaeromusa sp.]
MDKENNKRRVGRPAVSDEDFRKPRSFKATDAEWDQIKLKAKAAGFSSTSEYIRFKALG